ncbi:MAG: GNAT family N-acetyltransferase [Methanomicrobiales archaeon]|nr:GNAT family N-acetyltransferase [Methanomicrobiales archaeon]
MELIPYGRENGNEWDEVLHSCPEGTLFHTWDWLKTIEGHSWKRFPTGRSRGVLYPYLAMEGEIPVGLVPLFVYRHLLGTVVASPPFSTETAYLGPLLVGQPDLRSRTWQKRWHQFQECIDVICRSVHRASYISLHTSPGPFDPRSFFWAGYQVTPEFTFELDIRREPEKIRADFSKNLKYTLNKSERLGISVRRGDRNDLMQIVDLLGQRNRILGSRELIDALFQTFSSREMVVFVVERGDLFLGGVVIFQHKGRAAFWIGAPRVEYQGITPNAMAFWQAILWAREEGNAIFELIGASDQTLNPFKSKFNGQIAPFYVIKWYSPLTRLFNVAKDLGAFFVHR